MCEEYTQQVSDQIWCRIKASVAAYAYEFKSHCIMSDDTFDTICARIDPGIETHNKAMDTFFRKEFSKHTGMWIHKHPELEGIKALYNKYHSLLKT